MYFLSFSPLKFLVFGERSGEYGAKDPATKNSLIRGYIVSRLELSQQRLTFSGILYQATHTPAATTLPPLSLPFLAISGHPARPCTSMVSTKNRHHPSAVEEAAKKGKNLIFSSTFGLSKRILFCSLSLKNTIFH